MLVHIIWIVCYMNALCLLTKIYSNFRYGNILSLFFIRLFDMMYDFFYCRRWPESQIPWFSIYCSVINLHVQWSLSIQSIWLMVHIKAKMLLTEIYSNFWCWHEVSVFSVYHYSNRGDYFSLKSRNCPNLQNAIHKLPYIFSLLWSFLVLVVQCWFSEMFC